MYWCLALVLGAASARATLAAVVPGACGPAPPVAGVVDLKKVVGYWFGYESTGDDSSFTCPVVKIEFQGKKPVYIKSFIQDGKPYTTQDLAYYKDKKVFYTPNIFSTKKADLEPFVLLHLDPVSSAVLYRCKQITPTTKEVIAWKFSKDPAIPEHVRARNDEVVQRLPELATASWREHGRDNCPAPN